jgi:hypothetical protein
MSVFYATKTTPVKTGHHKRFKVLSGLSTVLFVTLYCSFLGQAQNGTLNFANTTNNTTATTGNTGFGGVRVGSGGGGFTIVNTGQEIGTQAELRGTAPSTASINSVGITSTEYGTSAQTFTISFEAYFTGGSSGIWYFFAGNGATFAAAQSGAFSGAQVFTGLRWTFGASNTITTNNRNAGSWVTTGITGTPIAQNTAYTISIVGNNTASTVNYGASQSVAANTFDFWVNGTLVGDDLAKAQLPATTAINAFRFYGESSTSNVAQIHLDNIKWWNTCVPPSISSYSSLTAIPANTYSDVNIYSNASLSGNVTVDAALSVTSGTLTTGANNLTLNASTGSAVIEAAGALNISGGTTDFNGRSVTFKSTASGTGYLANVAGTLNDATNVTVERYISAASNQAYRLLTPGVTTSTSIRANWQENTNNTEIDYTSNSNPNPGYGTHITGSADGSNGFDATTGGNAASAKSLYTYTPGNPGSWTAVANTNVNTLSATTGYLLYVRGSRFVNLTVNNAQNITNGTHGNTTLRATGTLQTGTINIPTSTANNFVLVANPYAAPLRWDATTGVYSLANNSTNFENYVTIWDPNQSTRGAYVTINSTGTVSAGALTQNLQTGQAFFVKVKSDAVGTPNFTLQESHKATSNSLDAFRLGTQQELLRAGLFFTHTDNTRRQADGVVTVYDNNYSAAFDGDDAMQIANWDEDVAIVSNNKELSIESRPLADNGDTIFFNMARLREINYEWEFVAENFNAPGLTAYVQDAFTNTETAISLSGTTVVPFTVTSNAASKAANRFRVVYRTSGVLPVTLTSVKAFQQNNGITVAWNTQSESGMQQYEVEKSANGTSFSKVNTTPAKSGTSNSYNYFDATPINGANYYRIKAISLNGDVKYSTIVVVRLGDKGTTLSVYPNPVKGNTVSIALNGLNKGNYTLSVFNQLGQQVLNRVVAHNGGNATQTIDLGKLSAGLYELRLSNGETVLTEKLIKE